MGLSSGFESFVVAAAFAVFAGDLGQGSGVDGAVWVGGSTLPFKHAWVLSLIVITVEFHRPPPGKDPILAGRYRWILKRSGWFPRSLSFCWDGALEVGVVSRTLWQGTRSILE